MSGGRDDGRKARELMAAIASTRTATSDHLGKGRDLRNEAWLRVCI
jgi:hypothetical protein